MQAAVDTVAPRQGRVGYASMVNIGRRAGGRRQAAGDQAASALKARRERKSCTRSSADRVRGPLLFICLTALPEVLFSSAASL